MLRLVKRRAAASDAVDAFAGIAKAAASGDPVAVRTFLVTIGPHLLRIVRRVLGARHPDVDDVTQECAFALIDALPNYRGESTVLHFACRIAVLTAMSARRREVALKRAALREPNWEVERLESSGPTPEAELSARAAAEVIRELLDSLPVEQAEALALHCVLGHTVPEIAEMVGVPLETARSRLRLAKIALRARAALDPRLEEMLEESS